MRSEKRESARVRVRLGLVVSLVASAGMAASAIAEDRSIDGSGNNIANPTWGEADSQLLRQGTVAYGDLTWTMARSTGTGPRQVSNAVAAQAGSILNARGMTDMVWQWGQFLDHDIDLTDAANPLEPAPIDTTGDPLFLGTPIGFNRSVWDPATGMNVANPRQQMNRITSYIDGSNVYGSDTHRNNALRSGVGGRLLTSAGDLLPFNDPMVLGTMDPLENANDTGVFMDSEMFVAGDVRANEQAGLTAMHTLWVREHNYWADRIATETSITGDEAIYQAARKIVGAEMQAITYNEWLPALTGSELDAYTGYDSNVNASIANEFSTAAFRLGHTMLSATLARTGNNGATIGEGNIDLRDAFFNPAAITSVGIDPYMKGLSTQLSQEIDNQIVDDVRNFLFGPPGAGGFDLASLNIQRGRDHGLADYNTLRADYGLAPVTDFDEISSDPAVQAALASVYNNVNEIDPWVGMLAEDHVGGGSLGELTLAIIEDQFARLRDGDRFFYLNDDGLGDILAEFGRGTIDIGDVTLRDVIRRNSDVTLLQRNVFLIPSPGAASMLAIAGLVAARRRRDA